MFPRVRAFHVTNTAFITRGAPAASICFPAGALRCSVAGESHTHPWTASGCVSWILSGWIFPGAPAWLCSPLCGLSLGVFHVSWPSVWWRSCSFHWEHHTLILWPSRLTLWLLCSSSNFQCLTWISTDSYILVSITSKICLSEVFCFDNLIYTEKLQQNEEFLGALLQLLPFYCVYPLLPVSPMWSGSRPRIWG